MNYLSLYCGLVVARISASEKDLPVITIFNTSLSIFYHLIYIPIEVTLIYQRFYEMSLALHSIIYVPTLLSLF